MWRRRCPGHASPAAVIRSKMSAFAPTSTPRVGSSSSSTRGSVSRALPITTFCWLPPLSEPIGACELDVLTVTALTMRSTAVRSLPCWTENRRTKRPRLASVRFCPTDIDWTRPSRWRSSGTSATPAARRWAIDSWSSGSPVERHVAADRPEPAGERLEQLGAPGAHEPVEADDLAGAHGERHRVDRQAPRVGWVGHHEVLDPQQLALDVGVLGREQLVRAAADHLLDDPARVDVRRLVLGDEPAVAEARRRDRRSRAPPRGGGRCRRSPRRARSGRG